MGVSSTRVKFLALALLISLGGIGCSGGIQLRPGDIAEGRNLPGSPSGPLVSVSSGAGGGLVTTDHLIVFVRTSAASFQGGLEGEDVRVADPFLESGIDLVFDEVNK